MNKNCDIQTLYADFSDKLKSYILHKVNDKVLAEDIMHDTFIKIDACCKQNRNCESPKSYLFQVANNTIADHYRKKYKPVSPAKEISIENEAANHNEELLNCLNPFIEQLPEKYKQAIILADIQQKPQQEIANLLNISLSATKSRIQRAREKLKTLFEKACRLEADKFGNIITCEHKNCPDKCRD
jgi:RNA polymerase sigma-70 factor, ECF subfamily